MRRRTADADQLRPADRAVRAAIARAALAAAAAAARLTDALALDFLRGFVGKLGGQHRADLRPVLVVIIGVRWVRLHQGQQGDLEYGPAPHRTPERVTPL